MNFSKNAKETRASKKKLNKLEERDEKTISNIDNKNVSIEDLVPYFKNKAKEIVARVIDDLSKIPEFSKCDDEFREQNINLLTHHAQLNKIAEVIDVRPEIIKIIPFNMEHKECIIKSLQAKYDFGIQSEANYFLIIEIKFSKDFLMDLIDKLKRIDDHMKEEFKNLKSAANKETEKQENIAGDSKIINKLILEAIEEEMKEADQNIINKTYYINKDLSNALINSSTSDINKLFFNYDKNGFNEDYSFHQIIHSKEDSNQKYLNEGFKGNCLYTQNRDFSFHKIKDILNFNLSTDKKILISLNNSNGEGKSHFLQLLQYKDSLKDYFFLPVVQLEEKPAPKAILEALLKSISEGFGLSKIARFRDFEINYEKTYIEDICYKLQKIKYSRSIEKEKEIKEYCIALFKRYFVLKDGEVFDPELILGKIKGKKEIVFCFDEIGKAQISNKKQNFKSISSHDEWACAFEDLPDTHNKLISMYETRNILNIINLTLGLAAIVAGKNDIESFMDHYSSCSPQPIRHINFPPLYKENIRPIIKFELYRNSSSNLRKYLKVKYPKECNKEEQDEFSEKMDLLIGKLYEYTAGQPRLLKFTLDNLMELDQ